MICDTTLCSLRRARQGGWGSDRQSLPSPRHRTAKDLTAKIQAEAPDVHISTVYGNLEELERLGVVSHVHLGNCPRPTTSPRRRTAISSARNAERCSRSAISSSRRSRRRRSRSTGSRSTPTISRCAGAAATASSLRPLTDPGDIARSPCPSGVHPSHAAT